MDDILITHTTVVTVDSSNHILRDGAIAIRGHEIVALGPTEVVSVEHPAREVIDARGMVALPGLVNGHVHMLTALYKGTMCGFGFDRTMGEDIDFCGKATPDIMLAASRLSAVEMLRSGITLANVAGDTAVFEIARQTPEALGQARMKAFVQTMLADMFGMIDLSADAQMAEAEMLLREYQGKFEGRVRAVPSVGEALATSLKTMRRLAALAQSTPTSTPVAQSKADVVSAEGNVVPKSSSDLAFRTGGRVAEVLVSEGDVVTRGQPLIRLQDDELRFVVAAVRLNPDRHNPLPNTTSQAAVLPQAPNLDCIYEYRSEFQSGPVVSIWEAILNAAGIASVSHHSQNSRSLPGSQLGLSALHANATAADDAASPAT